MSFEISAVSPSNASESDTIRKMIQRSSENARAMMQQQIAMTEETKIKMARHEIDIMSYQTERAMANELGNRTLQKLLGSFSLIQKIMQNMG